MGYWPRLICMLAFVWTAVHMPPSVVAAPTARDFGFGKREIYEFKNDLSQLTFCDINRDGRDDILFLNNRLSRLEILVRKPAPAAAATPGLPARSDLYEDRGFLLDQKTDALKVLDLNGDKRPDLVTAGTHRGLRIYFQTAAGGFDTPHQPRLKDSTQLVRLAVADFDRNGAVDLLVCRRDGAEILYNDGQGQFHERRLIDFSAPECAEALVGDFNADQRPDLIFYFPEERLPLRLYLGRSEGGFGWEHPLDIQALRALEAISLFDQPADQLVVILKNAVNMRSYGLEAEQVHSPFEASVLTPLRSAARGVGPKLPMAFAVADFDGDGFLDYCRSAPEMSRLMLHTGSAQGLNPVAQEIESLRRIKTMGVDRRGDLFVFSPEEKAVACHPRGHIMDFPTFAETDGVPLAMDVSPNAPGYFGLMQDKRGRLYFSQADRQGEKRTAYLSLPAERQVHAMRVVPVGEELWGVFLFTAYEKPLMYLWTGRRLEAVAPERLRALGATFGAEDIAPVGPAAAPGFIICEGQVARLYRLHDDRFEVERQFGLNDETAVLRFGVAAPGPGRAPGFLFYNLTAHALCWFAEAPGSTPLQVSFSDAFKEIAGLILVDSGALRGILMPGRAETRWLPEGVAAFTLKTLGGYSSRAPNPYLWSVFPVRLGRPPRPMAAALDARNASLELISAGPQGLEEEVSFKVFQGPLQIQEERGMRFEPREVATGDVNGDGLMDLGILVHDKLVIHLGE
jgi:hypothetical protein